MSRHSTRAFSLFESLCMIVVLCVFGWLCVGVIRNELKQGGKDVHEDIRFTTSDQDAPETQEPPPRPAADAKPAQPWKKLEPLAPAPAGVTPPAAPIGSLPRAAPAAPSPSAPVGVPTPAGSQPAGSQPAGSPSPVPAKP